MHDYDAYLFDWDGTLARTLELWLQEIYAQCQAYGLTAGPADVAREFGDLKWPLRFGLPEHLLHTFQSGVNDHVQTRLPNVALYDNAYDMLMQLRQNGKKLALITPSLRSSLESLMDRHGVTELFDVIITSEDVQHHKPDPEGIKLALTQLDVPASRAVMLGDSDKDLLAAKNAGVHSALFYPPNHEPLLDLSELQTHGPRYTIRAWQELLNQLQ